MNAEPLGESLPNPNHNGRGAPLVNIERTQLAREQPLAGQIEGRPTPIDDLGKKGSEKKLRKVQRSLLWDLGVTGMVIILIVVFRFLEAWLLHSPPHPKRNEPTGSNSQGQVQSLALDPVTLDCIAAAQICVEKGDLNHGIQLIRERLNHVKDSKLKRALLDEALSRPKFQPVFEQLRDLQVASYEETEYQLRSNTLSRAIQF